MNLAKWAATLSCALSIGITSVSFADSALNTACATYLNYSDAQFKALISMPLAAKPVASTLGAGELANTCSNISNNDSCAALLANRAFLSEYHANYSLIPSVGSLGGGGLHSSTPPATPNTRSSAPTTTTMAAAPAQQNSTASNDPKTTQNDTKTKSSSSIHWF